VATRARARGRPHALPALVLQSGQRLLLGRVRYHALDFAQLSRFGREGARAREAAARRGARERQRPGWACAGLGVRALRTRSRFSYSSAMLRCSATRCAMMDCSSAVSARPSKSRNRSSLLRAAGREAREASGAGARSRAGPRPGHAPLRGNLGAGAGEQLRQAGLRGRLGNRGGGGGDIHAGSGDVHATPGTRRSEIGSDGASAPGGGARRRARARRRRWRRRRLRFRFGLHNACGWASRNSHARCYHKRALVFRWQCP